MVNSSAPVVNAIIPAAGLGTRFLPFTKTVPKELLPLGNRPCVDFVVTEAVEAGISDVLFVSRPGKEAIVDYFAANPELNKAIAGTDHERKVQDIDTRTKGARIHSVNQGRPNGLGHAIAQGAEHVGNKPFAVLLPDDLIPEGEGLLEKMVAVRNALGGSVIAAIRVTPQQATAYGSIGFEPATSPTGSGVGEGDLLRVTKLVEKPPVDQVLSEYAVAGRYVLDPAVFEVLNTIEPGRGGEVQVTDALAKLATMNPADGGGLHAVVYDGPRYDTGTPEGYLDAYLKVTLSDPETRDATLALVANVLDETK